MVAFLNPNQGSELAVPSRFEDFPSSPTCPLSPNNSLQDRENKNNCMVLSSYCITRYTKQDKELDELSASVQRIGGVGLTIHDELTAQLDDSLQNSLLYVMAESYGGKYAIRAAKLRLKFVGSVPSEKDVIVVVEVQSRI
ncbi:unnamed protein product [Fraxinus pennsylvanica]|uniref:Uncharacterized protein n=1 Tax=Fraxinus pennsylvanica TaxID=56036 RepID=A0AAD2DGC3_9LAMI|nr:unnamed protein product [Fraxinus pennsylvanica]